MLHFVYALQFGDRVTIGTTTNLARRFTDMVMVVNRPTRPFVAGTFLGHACVATRLDAHRLQYWLGRQFAGWRINRDWYRADPTLVGAIDRFFADRAAVATTVAACAAGVTARSTTGTTRVLHGTRSYPYA